MPEAAFFCSLTAARIMHIPLPWPAASTTDMHVGVPAPRRALRACGTVGHKYQLRKADVRDWLGLRITTPARTWCDLAATLDVEDLVAAGDYLIHRPHPLATRAELADVVARHPARRGRARLLEALSLLDERAESPTESIIRVAIVRAGIRGLVVNLRITDAHGNVFRADLCFPAHRVIVEYQGDYHRTEPERWRKDRTRIALLTAANWHVIEIAADELADRRVLLQLVRDALALHPARVGRVDVHSEDVHRPNVHSEGA